MKRNKIVVILNNIRSAMNVGAILRTADAICSQKVYITGYSATPENPRVVKTSLGAEKTIPWEQMKNASDLISELKMNGYQIVGLEISEDALNFWQAKYKYPTALLLGNEIEGIPQDLLEMCDIIVKIPMCGSKESLNVATATGIALYEIAKPFINK